jgi:hypothetical protein
VAIVYFDCLESDLTSINIGVIRAHIVLDQKPVLVQVYDYYDTGKFTNF